MVTPELLTYIVEEARRGKSHDEIKAALAASQWSDTDILEAIEQSGIPSNIPAEKPPTHAPRKTWRNVVPHILLSLVLGAGAVYLFLVAENNYFLNPNLRGSNGQISTNQLLSTSPSPSPSSSYRRKLHNDQRMSDIQQLGRLIESYKQSEGNPTPPSTGGKIVNVDDPSNPLAKPEALVGGTPPTDPLPSKYHYTYQSDGMYYELTCVQTDPTNEDKVLPLFAVKDSKELTLDPSTGKPLTQK